MTPDVCLSVGLLVGCSVNSVCKLIIYIYLPFAIYCGKFTVFLLFTMVNLPFDLPRLLWSNNGGKKKVVNTAVNGKLSLTVGNPIERVLFFWDKCVFSCFLVLLLSFFLLLD